MTPDRRYTCTRHGGVRRSRPGRCPQCERDLVIEAFSAGEILDRLNPLHLTVAGFTLLAAITAAMLLGR